MTAPIEHPSWCRTVDCGVRLDTTSPVPGAVIGAHRSRPIVIEPGPGERLQVELSLWQIHGGEAFVSLDWNRPDDVPVDGIMFDIVEAGNVARVIRDLAALAEREGGAS